MSEQQKLIQKYLENRASEEEVKFLNSWVRKNKSNKQVFKDVVTKWNVSTKYNSEKFDSEKAFDSFLFATQNESSDTSVKKSILRRIQPALKYAASIAAVVLVSFYLFLPENKVVPEVDYTNSIVLKLDDGSIKVIEEEHAGPILSRNGEIACFQQSHLLSYQDVEGNSTGLSNDLPVFNEVIVPYGETFKVILSDGSSVLLNAGSSLKYPQKFTSNLRTRTVVLEGEAFFEIEKNADQPFIVQTADMNVKVLGTTFNVSAYSDDEFVKTVLVEGNVNVFDPNNVFEEINITPNQMAVFDRTTDKLGIVDVRVAKFTKWTNNKLLFDNEPFKDIAKVIERRYNVQIINNYDTLNDIKFYGAVNDESIDDIFKTFSTAVDFNYVIKDGSIIINRPDLDN